MTNFSPMKAKRAKQLLQHRQKLLIPPKLAYLIPSYKKS